MGGSDGSLCAFGPTSDVLPEYVFSCFGGPKSGKSLTIVNRYNSGIVLCDVKLMGKNRALFCILVLNYTISGAALFSKQYIAAALVIFELEHARSQRCCFYN